MKHTFILDDNTAYSTQRTVINIIGQRPKDRPYISVSVFDNNNQISQSWMIDENLERFAVNILKALQSKKLKP